MLGGQAGAYGIGVLVGIVVARLLGPAGTGAFGLVGSLLWILVPIGSLGVGAGALYWVSRGVWPPGEALRQVQIAAAVLGLLFACIGAAIAFGPAQRAFEDVPAEAILIGVAALPFVMSRNFSNTIAIAVDRQEVYALTVNAYIVLTLVLVLVLAPLADVTGAVTGMTIAAAVVAFPIFGRWSLRALPGPSPGWFRRVPSRLRAASSYGLRAYVPTALQAVNYRVDLIIVSAFAAQETVGQYSIALTLALTASLVPASLVQVVIARVAALDHDEGADEQRMVVIKSIRHTVVLTVLVCIAMALVLPLIPVVYGPGFRGAIEPGYVLVGATAGSSLVSAIGAVLLGKGRADYAMRQALVVTVVALGLYAALIPGHEAIGAAIGSAVSQLGGAVVGLLYFRREFPEVPFRELLPRRSDLGDYPDLLGHLRRRRVTP
jgi:O-antigen/teichoic acid export membrane protein